MPSVTFCTHGVPQAPHIICPQCDSGSLISFARQLKKRLEEMLIVHGTQVTSDTVEYKVQAYAEIAVHEATEAGI